MYATQDSVAGPKFTSTSVVCRTDSSREYIVLRQKCTQHMSQRVESKFHVLQLHSGSRSVGATRPTAALWQEVVQIAPWTSLWTILPARMSECLLRRPHQQLRHRSADNHNYFEFKGRRQRDTWQTFQYKMPPHVGFDSSPKLAAKQNIFGICLPSERGMDMRIQFQVAFTAVRVWLRFRPSSVQ